MKESNQLWQVILAPGHTEFSGYQSKKKNQKQQHHADRFDVDRACEEAAGTLISEFLIGSVRSSRRSKLCPHS